ncbi:MAG: hypothetical protein PVI90_08940, partial [Desulfobacteraceae bacterium]
MTDSKNKAISTDTLPTEIKSRLSSELPERYLIKDVGSERVLICLEAPNIQVRIKAGWSISSSAAKKSSPGTIFLDGAAQCEPFLDHEKLIYNLDHHEGCVRSFTLATCEQAMVMIMKGLDLQDREWKVYGNEPDLDTILSIWIILNGRRICSKDPLHQWVLFALVRLEGIIDSLGLELKELCALQADQMHKILRIIDHLRSEEIQLKKEGRWQGTDFLEYTVSVLHKIDHILYKSSEFADFKGVDELARTELTNNRIVAVVESDLGIYELEPHLSKLYGNRLGWVALRTAPNTYTLRQMDLFMPVSLEDVYPRLNFIDPAVKSRNRGNKWGGSSDIGGSPRESGTRLSPQEVANACRDVVSKRSSLLQIRRFGKTSLQIFGIVTIAELFHQNWHPTQWIDNPIFKTWLNIPEIIFFLLMLLFTLLALLGYAHRRPWQYGLISPAGKDWLTPLPLGVLCGIAGGILIHPTMGFGYNPYFEYATAFLLAPLTLELLFRSLAHGLLAQTATIQDNQSPWFLSWPNLAAAILYAVFICFHLLYHSTNYYEILKNWVLVKHFLAAMGFALVAGIMRERSQSVITAYMLHVTT